MAKKCKIARLETTFFKFFLDSHLETPKICCDPYCRLTFKIIPTLMPQI